MTQAQFIVMPKFGQMVEESTIVKWRKKEGDSIKRGDVLFEIETDKATMEVESFLDGTLLKILVGEGTTVPVQAPVGFIGNPGDALPEVKMPPPVRKDAPAAPRAAETQQAPPRAPAPHAGTAPAPAAPAPAPQSGPGRPRISPRAAKLVRECAIDFTPIAGSGPGGRIVEADVRRYLAERRYDRLLVSPSAKKLAVKEKIDLLALEGSGDSGRILLADVEQAVAEKPKPMSQLRRTIARRLTQSFTTTPHFYCTVEADMTGLLAHRAELKRRGAPYTVTDFVVKALVEALVEFPDVNGSTDGDTVRRHCRVHLGLAVAIDRGLVVPVIRNADRLSMDELHGVTGELARKARDGKLLPNEMTGGTFTISNMGMLDVENFCAIINPGEGAILAVASIVKKPVVAGDAIVARSRMKMTLSADHRLIDGAVGARFVNCIKHKLEDIAKWKTLT